VSEGKDGKCRASDGKPGYFSNRLTTVPGSPSPASSAPSSIHCISKLQRCGDDCGCVPYFERVRGAANGCQSSERIVSRCDLSASNQRPAVSYRTFFLICTLLRFPSNYAGCFRCRRTGADSARFVGSYRQEQIHANLARGNIAGDRSRNYSWEISSTFLNYLSPAGAEGFP